MKVLIERAVILVLTCFVHVVLLQTEIVLLYESSVEHEVKDFLMFCDLIRIVENELHVTAHDKIEIRAVQVDELVARVIALNLGTLAVVEYLILFQFTGHVSPHHVDAKVRIATTGEITRWHRIESHVCDSKLLSRVDFGTLHVMIVMYVSPLTRDRHTLTILCTFHRKQIQGFLWCHLVEMHEKNADHQSRTSLTCLAMNRDHVTLVLVKIFLHTSAERCEHVQRTRIMIHESKVRIDLIENVQNRVLLLRAQIVYTIVMRMTLREELLYLCSWISVQCLGTCTLLWCV